MVRHSFYLLSSVVLARCQTIVFDGRVPATAVAAEFDAADSLFDPDFTKGQSVSFSDLLLFSASDVSLLDTQVNAQSVEVTINDDSIFAPGGANPQTAVRRAELMPNPALSADNVTTTGVKTLHFSVKPSADRPLNTSHEYLVVFLERADFTGNQISLKTGTLLGSDGATKDRLVLLGNTNDGSTPIFSTAFEEGIFTNFAMVMDFNQNNIQVFQSTGSDALVQQTELLPNDLSGNGAFHFGVNKNPIDPGVDVLRTGIQEAGILEGVVYGGIFVEDSADGTVTLS
ncbi:glycoside hydrolase family 131 protein [Lentithecium fluviatile CBS 122367]|uniref:Glycoside hydrolase family 131 protein n=1 Tax=Lentithecium fluviatile CBS 122367 TaxID=1168545 RepID=A0A6G1IQU4_9PLEO|nr:glycoside hydrolase family 131 protein [Lentithecium fluviatile CBS 122367]